MHTQFRKLIASTAILSVLLSGCTTVSSQIPIDPSDTCEQYRQPLRQAEEEQQRLMATWVAGGIAAGLIAGGACALAGGKAVLCAPIGAALLLGSLVGGYMQQKSRETNNQAELQHAVDNDSSVFGEQLGQLGRAAHNLNQCRQQQIVTITKHYQAKQVDRQAAQDQLAQVELKLGQDQELINAFLDEANKRTDMQVKARATAANLPPEKYVAQIDPGYVQPAVTEVAVQEPSARKKARLVSKNRPQVEVASLKYQNMKGAEPTQKTYNMNKSVAQQSQSDISETQRLLAQTKELLG